MAIADPAMMTSGDDLDSTIVRKLDDIKHAIASKPPFPPWLVGLVIYLVGQLVGGVWWAATMQSDLRYLQNDNAKVWQEIGVLKLKNEKLENGFDEKVRVKVRETLDDWGYLRVRPRKDE